MARRSSARNVVICNEERKGREKARNKKDEISIRVMHQIDNKKKKEI